MWDKQPVLRADGGAGPPAHQHILPSVPGDVYTLVRVYRTSGLTKSRVLISSPQTVSPSSCWVGLHLFWVGSPILQEKQERVRNVLFRPPEPGHQRRRELVLWGMSREGGGISQLLMGEESWEGREGGGGDTSLAAWVQRPAPPNTANSGWYSPKSDLHIGFSYWLR